MTAALEKGWRTSLADTGLKAVSFGHGDFTHERRCSVLCVTGGREDQRERGGEGRERERREREREGEGREREREERGG